MDGVTDWRAGVRPKGKNITLAMIDSLLLIAICYRHHTGCNLYKVAGYAGLQQPVNSPARRSGPTQPTIKTMGIKKAHYNVAMRLNWLLILGVAIPVVVFCDNETSIAKGQHRQQGNIGDGLQ